MAITVTYALASVKSEFVARFSDLSQGPMSDELAPSIFTLADGGYAVAYEWNAGPDEQMFLERYTADGTFRPSGSPNGVTEPDAFSAGFAVNDVTLTQLTTGQILAVWTDGAAVAGLHRATVDPANGNILAAETQVPGTDSSDFLADVAALQNGGYVVVKQDNLAANDQDADVMFFSAAGALVQDVALGDNTSSHEQAPAVAVLNNGNVAVAYEKELVDGGGTFGMAYEIYTEAGVVVVDQTVFDAVGTQNRAPDIVALQDGGFAIGYEDNGYGEIGVTVAIRNADGSLRFSVRADSDFFSNDDVRLAVLSNGYVAASWTDNGVDIHVAIIDPVAGVRVAGPFVIEDQNGQQESSAIAALVDGSFVTAWTDYNSAIADGNTDPDLAHVSMQIDRFERTSIGDAAADIITGDALIDFMFGGGGNDVLIGRAGGDFLDGQGGSDTVSYAGAAARVKIALDGSIAAEGDALGDTLVSFSRLTGTALGDVLRGDANANTIRGGSGSDTIQGMAGNDNLYGETGNDALTGGLGNDFFSYSALAQGGDTIKDFANAVGNDDTLRFTGAAFGGLLAGPLAANRFAANLGGAATTADHRFIYETDTGILRFDSNGTGAGGVTVIATLTGAPVLALADFVII